MRAITAQTSVRVVDSALGNSEPVARAVARFERDMGFALLPSEERGTKIEIGYDPGLGEEGWSIEATEETLALSAGDPLGAVYGLSRVSSVAFGIDPLWFWNDQRFERKKSAAFPLGRFHGEKKAYRFRGWFLNDEVLLSAWKCPGDWDPWEMAFEALLRLGGNLVIPGTDAHARNNARLAASMGLWITHHHAEPLGAEMFSRAYPEKRPSYLANARLFEGLWRDAVERQKDGKVVWTIGFRGQGDAPFWDNDPQFDTDEKRGALITAIMERQATIIRERQPDAAMACNLYGESVELYRKGHVRIPKNAIRIWGDNGYGRMVSRRQGLSNPRHPAIPEESERDMAHGMYYHASFYDLQAANHVTMTPVSLGLMKLELENAYANGVDDLLVLNVSNVKPHAMPAAFVADFWRTGSVDVDGFLRRYARSYFPEHSEEVAKAFADYSESALPYGEEEDERAGDQFYAYTLRGVLGQWIKGDVTRPIQSLLWFVSGNFPQQVRRIHEMSESATAGYGDLCERYEKLSRTLGQGKTLFDDTLGMYARLYRSLARTLSLFAESALSFIDGRYLDSFLSCGEAAEESERAESILREWEHGKWERFYANDCLTDVGENAYLLKILMEHIRAFEDAPEYYKWQRLLTYSEEDKNVALITNWEKHMTAWELYQAHKKRQSASS